MKKINIRETIYSKRIGDGSHLDVLGSDLPTDILPTDIINIVRDNGHYSENNSHEAFTMVNLYREREETDEEYDARMKENKIQKEEYRERRIQSYLKLHEEFGDTDLTEITDKKK